MSSLALQSVTSTSTTSASATSSQKTQPEKPSLVSLPTKPMPSSSISTVATSTASASPPLSSSTASSPSPLSSSSTLSSPSPSPSSSSSILPSIIAGYASGICAVVVGHPMDSAKVWLQTNTNVQQVVRTTAKSTTHTSRNMMINTLASTTTTTATTTSVANMSTLATAPITSTNTTAAASSSSSAMPTWRMVRALYAGVTGPLLTVGVVQSCNFAIYETTRRELFRLQQQQQQQQSSTTTSTTTCFDRNQDSLWNVGLAGGASGVVLSVMTAPILLVKTTSQVRGIGFRQSLVQVMLGGSGSKSTSITLLPSYYRVGFGIHSWIEIISRSVYYPTYEGCKRTLKSWRQQQQPAQEETSPSSSTFSNSHTGGDGNTLMERMISAAAAGIGCWAIIFPLDSIRSRMYAQMASVPTTTTTTTTSLGNHVPLSAWDMAKVMYQQGISSTNHNHSSSSSTIMLRLRSGLRPFFRGFGVTVLRAGPVAAVALPVYDYVLQQVVSHP